MAGNVFQKPAQAVADALSTPDPNAVENAELVNSAARAFANPPVGFVNEAANAVTQAFAPQPATGAADPAAAAADPAAAASAPLQLEPPLQQLGTVPVAPMQLAPPGDLTVREGQVQKGLTISPEVKAGLKQGAALEQQGLVEEAAAATNDAAAEAEALYKDADSVDALAKRLEKNQEDYHKHENELQEQWRDQTAQAEAKVDPNRLWDNMPASRKALAIFGILLTGFRTGTGPSAALQTLDDAIARDIDAQKSNIGNAQRNKDQTRDMLHTFQQLGMSRQESEILQQKVARTAVETKLKGMLARTKDAHIQAGLAQALGLQQQKIADLQLTLDKLGEDKRTYGWKTMPGAAAGPSLKDQIAQQGAENDTLKMWQTEGERKGSPLNAAREAKANLRRFRNYIAAGADEVALTDFIATTMKQGSYSPQNFAEAIKVYGTVEKVVEAIRRAVHGGVNKGLIKSLETAMEADARATKAEAATAIKKMWSQGHDPAIVLGDESMDQKATNAGAMANDPTRK